MNAQHFLNKYKYFKNPCVKKEGNCPQSHDPIKSLLRGEYIAPSCLPHLRTREVISVARGFDPDEDEDDVKSHSGTSENMKNQAPLFAIISLFYELL